MERRRQEHLASGLPSKMRYRCTFPTQRCDSSHTYNSNHIPNPFPISFRSTYKQILVLVHNQPKILWRFSCTASLVTDLPHSIHLCIPLSPRHSLNIFFPP